MEERLLTEETLNTFRERVRKGRVSDTYALFWLLTVTVFATVVGYTYDKLLPLTYIFITIFALVPLYRIIKWRMAAFERFHEAPYQLLRMDRYPVLKFTILLATYVTLCLAVGGRWLGVMLLVCVPLLFTQYFGDLYSKLRAYIDHRS